MSRNEAGEAGRVLSAGFERNTGRGSLQVRVRFAEDITFGGVNDLEHPLQAERRQRGIIDPAQGKRQRQ